jgi:flagellar biosynthesis/type III secretory pathway protein FliH
MSMVPGSSRAYILELEQDKAMLQGALEAANEQNEQLQKRGQSYDAGFEEGWAAGKERNEAEVKRLQRGVDAWQKTAEDYERENERLRAALKEIAYPNAAMGTRWEQGVARHALEAK